MTCATQLDPNQLNQCFTASFVRARERQIRPPKKRTLGGMNRGPYPAQVTVYPYNRHIKSTNPIVRHVTSLTCTLKRMRANQRTPKHVTTQPLHGSNTRAPAPNFIASQIITGAHCSLSGSYLTHVTMKRYNGHISGTNMNVRCSNISSGP